MEIYDFITISDIERIADKIKNRDNIKYEHEKQGYRFNLRSSKASHDWDEEVKQGDYIILMGLQASSHGSGIPVVGNKLKELSEVSKLTNFIDSYLSNNKIENYKKVNEGQLNLFAL